MRPIDADEVLAEMERLVEEEGIHPDEWFYMAFALINLAPTLPNNLGQAIKKFPTNLHCDGSGEITNENTNGSF